MSASDLALRFRPGAGSRARLVLDRTSYQRRERRNLLVEGWVIHPAKRLRSLVLAQSGRDVGEASIDLASEAVGKAYADWPGAARCGFRLELPGPGTYSVLAKADEGEQCPVGEIELRDTSEQRLFFMHIAKAGGSSVNAYFSRQFAPDEATRHLESDPAWQNDPQSLEQRYFLSGHVNSVAIDRHLSLDGFRRVTVLREPLEQVISHLAWIRRLAVPGEEERYEAHPPYVQAFADKLAAMELGDPRSLEDLVTGLTREERGLVDNCQCRYLTNTVPEWVRDEHVPPAIERLGWFHHVGFVDRLDDFLAEVSRAMGWPLPIGRGRENVTRDFFGLSASHEDQRAALAPLTRFDAAVIAAARNRSRKN